MNLLKVDQAKKPIDILKFIQVEYLAAAHPNMPKAYIVPTRYNQKTANGLTKCICNFLKYTGNQAERISNTGRQIKINGAYKWITGSGVNGTADISGTIAGRSVKIEVKININNDVQSDAQKKYQKSIESAGGIYFIAKDFDSFYYWYLRTFTNDEKGLKSAWPLS